MVSVSGKVGAERGDGGGSQGAYPLGRRTLVREGEAVSLANVGRGKAKLSPSKRADGDAPWQKASLTRTLEGLTVEQPGDTVIRLTAKFDLPDVRSKHQTSYTVLGSGDIIVENLITIGAKDLPELPRFGMRLRVPDAFERVEWYGRGPHENYWDRAAGAFVGLYKSTVCEQFVPYVSPLALGSFWALLPAGLSIFILVARIRNEEKVLTEELDGYREYKQRVKYRLIPGIW